MLLVTSIGWASMISVHTVARVRRWAHFGRLDLALDVAALPHPSAEAFNPIIHALALGDSAESPSHKPSSGHSVGSALLETIADGIYEDERWSPPALSLTEGPGANSDSPGGLERAWGFSRRCDAAAAYFPMRAAASADGSTPTQESRLLPGGMAPILFSDSAGVELEATLNTAHVTQTQSPGGISIQGRAAEEPHKRPVTG